MPEIVPIRRPVNEDCVRVLRNLLEMAETGELVSVAACGTLADSTIHNAYSSTPNQLLEIAAVDRLRHRLHLRMDAAGD